MTCIWHGEWPYIPNRIPLIIKPRKWALPDGFPHIWIKKLIPLMPFPSGCEAIDETIRPDSDVDVADYETDPTPSQSKWSNLDNNSESDRVTFNGSFRGQFGLAQCSSFTTNIRLILGMANPSVTPGGFDCQGMRYRWRFKKDDGVSSGTIDVNDLRVRQGTTTKVGPFDHGTLGTSYTTLTRTLDQSDFESITDFNDLQLYMDVDACSDAPLDFILVSIMAAWCEIEFFTK